MGIIGCVQSCPVEDALRSLGIKIAGTMAQHRLPFQSLAYGSLWLMLMNGTGCLKVIPGSNKWGLLPSESNGMHLEPTEDVEARGALRSLPMRAGDILAFGQYTFHASGENSTEEVRWSIDLRYSPTGHDMDWLFERYPGFIARSRSDPALG